MGENQIDKKKQQFVCMFCNYNCKGEKRFDLHCQTKEHLERVEEDKKYIPMLKEQLEKLGLIKEA